MEYDRLSVITDIQRCHPSSVITWDGLGSRWEGDVGCLSFGYIYMVLGCFSLYTVYNIQLDLQ